MNSTPSKINRLNFHLLTALGLSHESAEIVMDRIGELETGNTALREVATRLIALRNASGRIDLTDSSKRAEVYSLVARADEILNAKPNHHPMSSVDCRP